MRKFLDTTGHSYGYDFFETDSGDVFRAESLEHALKKRINNYVYAFDRLGRSCRLAGADYAVGHATMRVSDSEGRIHAEELWVRFYGPGDIFCEPWEPGDTPELNELRDRMRTAAERGNPNVRIITRPRSRFVGLPVFSDQVSAGWPTCHLENDLTRARRQMRAAGLE
jgi:hypothetical protein